MISEQFMRRVFVLVLAFGLALQSSHGDDKENPKAPPKPGYLGVYMEARRSTVKGPGSVLLTVVVANSPAENAGLRNGDLLVGFGNKAFAVDLKTVLAHTRNFLKQRKAGDTVQLLIERVQIKSQYRLGDGKDVQSQSALLPDLNKLLKSSAPGVKLKLEAAQETVRMVIPVVLGARPGRRLETLPGNQALRPEIKTAGGLEDKLLTIALTVPSMEKAFKSVLARFEEDEKNDDGFRLAAFRYLHRDPRALPAFGRDLSSKLEKQLQDFDIDGILATVGPLLKGGAGIPRFVWDEKALPTALPRPPGGTSCADHVSYVLNCMERAAFYREQALKTLSKQERDFLLKTGYPQLCERFTEDLYLHTDKNKVRMRNNLRSLELLVRVDRSRLIKAARELSPLCERSYLKRLRRDLLNEFAGIMKAVVFERDSPFGRVRVYGSGSNLQQGRCGLVIDLGGDDVYRAPIGAGYGDQFPVSVALDLGGDDQYQNTSDGSQGSGLLALGLLVDVSGDDIYLSSGHGSQGMAFAGVGLLVDGSGDDDYRGRTFAQGATLAVGYGALIDGAGHDSLTANLYSQGFAGPGGIGTCLQLGGDDRYLGGVEKQSSYGFENVFRGFCQGAACGFRNYASGGIALLLDSGGGKDRYTAGNFSQGGGYYFGLGMLVDRGISNDRYTGSRYAQGFSAHSAGGFLYDEGGDDRYRGVVGALQGAAWDLSFSAFIDDAGNDAYWGMNAFSQGASAHNGFALFFDHGGRDRYQHSIGPGSAKPNDYHGGVSFSLYIDGGVGLDRFSGFSKNGRRAALRDARGLWIDTGGEKLDSGVLKRWLKVK
jgi:hypothetical protein